MTGGRFLVGSGSLVHSKLALSICIPYAWQRKQFGPSKNPEVPLMEYTSHQIKIIPLLARSISLDFGLKWIIGRYANRSNSDIEVLFNLLPFIFFKLFKIFRELKLMNK
jgi:acyl-CoA oxidase